MYNLGVSNRPFFIGVEMENVGYASNGWLGIFLIAFLLPFFFKGLIEMLAVLFPPNETLAASSITLEDIKQAALQRAVEGDNASRKWVMDNIFIPQQKKQKKQSVKFLTDKKVMKDALDALIAVKHKKEDAKKVVVRLSKKKKYNTAGELLIDAFKVI